MRHIRLSLARPWLIPVCLAILLFACAHTAHAQGCSMCRDTTAGAAPQIRAGLRKAIPILAIPAIALFVGFFVARPALRCLEPQSRGHRQRPPMILASAQ